jgi:hypothetical protein
MDSVAGSDPINVEQESLADIRAAELLLRQSSRVTGSGKYDWKNIGASMLQGFAKPENPASKASDNDLEASTEEHPKESTGVSGVATNNATNLSDEATSAMETAENGDAASNVTSDRVHSQIQGDDTIVDAAAAAQQDQEVLPPQTSTVAENLTKRVDGAERLSEPLVAAASNVEPQIAETPAVETVFHLVKGSEDIAESREEGMSTDTGGGATSVDAVASPSIASAPLALEERCKVVAMAGIFSKSTQSLGMSPSICFDTTRH